MPWVESWKRLGGHRSEAEQSVFVELAELIIDARPKGDFRRCIKSIRPTANGIQTELTRQLIDRRVAKAIRSPSFAFERSAGRNRQLSSLGLNTFDRLDR